MNNEDGASETTAQHIRQMIIEKSGAGLIVDQPITTIPTVTFLVPRGRFDVDFFGSFLRLRGRSTDFKIPYSSVVKMFSLDKIPHSSYFIMSLEPPLRQGQTKYENLVMQLDTTKQITVEFTKGDSKEEIKDVASGVMIELAKKTIPQRIYKCGGYTSTIGTRSVKCTIKADDGWLYPIEGHFIFVHKPTIIVRFEEIASIEFGRIGGSTGASNRTFDFIIHTRSDVAYSFTNIQREEHSELYNFVAQYHFRIINSVGESVERRERKPIDKISDDDKESEDEDFDLDEEEEEEEEEEEDDII
jgi:structure-specific recognition protein 1